MAAGLLRTNEGDLVAMSTRLTITEAVSYGMELSTVDSDRLSAAAAGIDAGFGVVEPGLRRYIYYRRKGYTPGDALSFAIAWSHNAVDQFERRLSHETGAEGWRRFDVV